MTQLSFAWPTRFEQAGAYWSYVEYPARRVVWRRVGPHCIDLAWPWFHSWSLTHD